MAKTYEDNLRPRVIAAVAGGMPKAATPMHRIEAHRNTILDAIRV